MPHPCKRISSFHLIIIGLSLLINHTPKSKPQNLASRKFHKILDDHIILHKTRGGSTSAPSFSASFCSLCTWSKVVILIEALAEIQKMWNCAIGCPEKPKIFFWALPTSHPVLDFLNSSDGIISFWFWDFTMGNRPKMSLKYAIFKICPKLARNDIHVKQESVPPMGVLDSSFIKALGVKSAGLKKIFLVFQDTLLCK